MDYDPTNNLGMDEAGQACQTIIALRGGRASADRAETIKLPESPPQSCGVPSPNEHLPSHPSYPRLPRFLVVGIHRLRTHGRPGVGPAI